MTSNTKERQPAPMTVDADAIPTELKQLRRWVLWRWDWNGKKWDKPPKQVDGEDAKSNDPSTWFSPHNTCPCLRLPPADRYRISEPLNLPRLQQPPLPPIPERVAALII